MLVISVVEPRQMVYVSIEYDVPEFPYREVQFSLVALLLHQLAHCCLSPAKCWSFDFHFIFLLTFLRFLTFCLNFFKFFVTLFQ